MKFIKRRRWLGQLLMLIDQRFIAGQEQPRRSAEQEITSSLKSPGLATPCSATHDPRCRRLSRKAGAPTIS